MSQMGIIFLQCKGFLQYVVVCFILYTPHLTKRRFCKKGFKDGNHSCYEKQADVEHAFGGVSLLRRFAT